MGIKDFKLKWAHSMCRGKPMYLTKSKILVPCDFYIKTLDISANSFTYQFKPEIRIGSCSCLPELGIVAVTERREKGSIFVLGYPEMSEISTLEQTNNEEYAAVQFMGLEFLLSVQFRKSYDFGLWKWSSGEAVHFLSFPLEDSETPNIELVVNPLWWHQVMVQSNTRLILIEVKKSSDCYHLDATSYFFLEHKNGDIDLYRRNTLDLQQDFQADAINPQLKTLTIQCFCWLPENNVLVATSSGILRFEYEESSAHKLTENKAAISSMVLSKSSLFVGYKTGFIDVVNIGGHRWKVMETVKVGQPVIHSFMSLDYDFLTITTLKGSIILYQLDRGQLDSKTAWKTEFGGEVGVAFIGPLAKYSVVTRKNGFLHIFRTHDGGIVSTFQIDEEISTMASSPLCWCVVIGSNIGFLYFIDCTNPRKPKIVHCERPYDIPIDHLKFDNFGRFIVAAAQNQAVKIWNGLPSSGFSLLGSCKIATQVKDLNVFGMKATDETVLLILMENGSESGKEAKSILSRITLPSDFSSDSKKYQIDVFGTLSGDALNFQKRVLNNPACKIELHWKVGAVLYSSTNSKIQKYPIWSDFDCIKLKDMLTINNASDMHLALNQRWLTVADFCGRAYLYSTDDFNLYGSSKTHTSTENTNKSFVDMPLSSNNLICGRENGTILCYEWAENSSCIHTIPEWVVHCCLNCNKENESLRTMDEEEKIDVTPQDAEKNVDALGEIYEELEVWICVICFKLNQLVDNSDMKYETTPSNFVLEDDSFSELSKVNRKKVLFFLSEELQADVRAFQDRNYDNAIETLSSINLGFLVENYCNIDIENDAKLAEILSVLLINKANNEKKHVTNILTFNKSVKLKCQEERLSILKDLIHQICNLKRTFNEEFDTLFQKKSSICDSFDVAYLEAKRLSQTLPSKAERDFWNASIERKYSLPDDWTTERLKDPSDESDKYESNAVEEVKSSIECQMQSSHSIQEKFDSDVEALLLKKRYCDYNISRFEAKIYIMLLFTTVQDEFSNWRCEAENEIKNLETLDNEMDSFLKQFPEAEKNIKDTFLEFQKFERTSSYKLKVKCDLLHGSKGAIRVLQKQLPMKLDDCSQNPFCRSSASINTDDFTSAWKEFYSRNSCPSIENNSDWESVCNKQLRILTLGILMRNLQNQAIHMTHTKQKCHDVCLKLKENTATIQKALKSLSALISIFTMKFQALLTILLEKTDLKLIGDCRSEAEVSLKSIPASHHPVWKDIDRESYRIQAAKQHLDEVESLFQRLNKLKSNMYSKTGCVKTEYLAAKKDIKEKLEEGKHNFLKTKSAAEDFVDGYKKRLFKTLKSSALK